MKAGVDSGISRAPTAPSWPTKKARLSLIRLCRKGVQDMPAALLAGQHGLADRRDSSDIAAFL
jgi:hypothetical protein